MMRNVALGAVLGFAVVVLLLSIFGNSPPPPAPAPVPAAAPAAPPAAAAPPAPAPASDAGMVTLELAPSVKLPRLGANYTVREEMLRARIAQRAAAADAGAADAGR